MHHLLVTLDFLLTFIYHSIEQHTERLTEWLNSVCAGYDRFAPCFEEYGIPGPDVIDSGELSEEDTHGLFEALARPPYAARTLQIGKIARAIRQRRATAAGEDVVKTGIEGCDIGLSRSEPGIPPLPSHASVEVLADSAKRLNKPLSAILRIGFSAPVDHPDSSTTYVHGEVDIVVSIAKPTESRPSQTHGSPLRPPIYRTAVERSEKQQHSGVLVPWLSAIFGDSKADVKSSSIRAPLAEQPAKTCLGIGEAYSSLTTEFPSTVGMFAFAVPRRLKPVVPGHKTVAAMVNRRTAEKLGIGIPSKAVPVSNVLTGIRIDSVKPGSPAARAELSPGMVIAAINGDDMFNISHSEVTAAINRAGHTFCIEVVIPCADVPVETPAKKSGPTSASKQSGTPSTLQQVSTPLSLWTNRLRSIFSDDQPDSTKADSAVKRQPKSVRFREPQSLVEVIPPVTYGGNSDDSDDDLEPKIAKSSSNSQLELSFLFGGDEASALSDSSECENILSRPIIGPRVFPRQDEPSILGDSEKTPGVNAEKVLLSGDKKLPEGAPAWWKEELASDGMPLVRTLFESH